MNRHLTADERSALLAGFATQTEINKWRAHAAQCADCRLALAADEQILLHLEAQPLTEISSQAWSNCIHGALKIASEEKSVSKRQPASARAWFFPLWVWRVAAVAGVFLIGYQFGANHNARKDSAAGAGTGSEPVARQIVPADAPEPRQPLPDPPRQFTLVKADDSPVYGLTSRLF